MLCAIDFDNLHTVLRSLYDEMMPLCSDMAGVAQAIAGLGALFYVAVRIWIGVFLALKIKFILPYLLAFAAGAMVFVVVEELVPESMNSKYKTAMAYLVLVGFVLMMVLELIAA